MNICSLNEITERVPEEVTPELNLKQIKGVNQPKRKEKGNSRKREPHEQKAQRPEISWNMQGNTSRSFEGLYGLTHSNFWRLHPNIYCTYSNAFHSKYNLYLTMSQVELT